MFGEKRVIDRSEGPVTSRDIYDGVTSLGIQPGQVVLAHVSLSQVGWIAGGAQAVLDALLSALGDTGTLVMPAFSSGWSEPSYWCAPPVPDEWYETIRAQMPSFDPLKTPTRGVGRTAELFRTYPDVIRGTHPQVSFAAHGPKAQEIVNTDELNIPFGESGPLARLYELDAQVLLLGCGYESCTSLHLAERRMRDDPTRELVAQGAAMTRDGERQWVEFETFETAHDDFVEVGDAFEAECLESWSADTIGIGVSRLISMRELVDYSKIWLEVSRGGHEQDSQLEKSDGMEES